MKQCKCGAALDYAPDDVTACWACRDRVMPKACDVALSSTIKAIAPVRFEPLESSSLRHTMPPYWAWQCDGCHEHYAVARLTADMYYGRVFCPYCIAGFPK